MRKITQDIAEAFYAGNSLLRGNTTTTGEEVYLHGNLIAKSKGDTVMLTLAGWNTVTTRERLNGILETLGFDSRYSQKDFEPMLDGEAVAADEFQTFIL